MGFSKNIAIIIISAFIIVACVKSVERPSISSYEECVAAGNPIMESYPEQCSDGINSFTRKLSDEEKRRLNLDLDDPFSSRPDKSELLRQCPEAWIENKMPVVVEPGDDIPKREYLILDGQNRTPDEFDLNWIETNCEISSAEVVY